MKKLYEKPTKATLIKDNKTGEYCNIVIENRLQSYGRNSLKSSHKRSVYMNDLSKIVNLNKTEQLMLFAIFNNVNEYNIVISKWNDIAKDITDDPSRISKVIKVLKEQKFIAKIESKHMVNPYIVLPKFRKEDPEAQWLVQQLWSLYTEDMNIYIPEEYHGDVKFILGVDKFLESDYIKVGSKENSKIIKKPQPN